MTNKTPPSQPSETPVSSSKPESPASTGKEQALSGRGLALQEWRASGWPKLRRRLGICGGLLLLCFVGMRFSPTESIILPLAGMLLLPCTIWLAVLICRWADSQRSHRLSAAIHDQPGDSRPIKEAYKSKALLFTCPQCGQQFEAVHERSWPIKNHTTFIRSFLGFTTTRCPHCETSFQAKLPICNVVALAVISVDLLALMGICVELGNVALPDINWVGWALIASLTAGMLYALVKNATTRGARPITPTDDGLGFLGTLAVMLTLPTICMVFVTVDENRMRVEGQRMDAASKATDPKEKIRLYTLIIENHHDTVSFGDRQARSSHDPEFAQMYCKRAEAFNANGEPDKAIADYAKAIGLNPRCADAHRGRIEIFLAAGKYNEAIEYAKHADELIRPLPEDSFESMIRQRVAWAEAQSLKKAAEARTAEAMSNILQGNGLAAKGEYDKAIDVYSKTIAHNPFDPFDPYFPAWDHGHAWDYDEARAYVRAYNGRGCAFAKKGDCDKALADFNAALALSRWDAETHFNRGNALLSKGDWDKAIADYSAVIEPRLYTEPHILGSVLYNDTSSAATTLNPPYAPYSKRARAFYMKKNYERAWADVKKCQELGGQVDADFLKDLRDASERNE